MKKKYTYSAIGILFAIAALVFVTQVNANPSILPQHGNCALASATSSTTSLSTSTPTVTLSCDSYSLATNVQDPTAIDAAVLAVQLLASTSSNVININVQYSNDNIDWYDSNLGSLATTSATSTVSAPNVFTWTAGGTSRVNKVISIDTPTRYVRAVFSSSFGPMSTSSVWAEFIPKKQVR